MVHRETFCDHVEDQTSKCANVAFPFLCFRRKAVQVQLGGLRMAIRAFGRIDAPLPQAHRREAVQMPALRPMLLPQRPSSSPHEETRVINRFRERSQPRVTLRGWNRQDLFLVKIAKTFDICTAKFTRSSIFRGHLIICCKWEAIDCRMPKLDESREIYESRCNRYSRFIRLRLNEKSIFEDHLMRSMISETIEFVSKAIHGDDSEGGLTSNQMTCYRRVVTFHQRPKSHVCNDVHFLEVPCKIKWERGGKKINDTCL